MKKVIIIFLALGFSSYILASSGGEGKELHVPHLSDLLFPVLNFSVLFGFIFWKFRKPLSKMFKEKSLKVEDLYNLANEKSKKAQIKYEMYKKKMNSAEADIDKIFTSNDIEIKDYENLRKKDLQETIEKLQVEMETKLKMEKKDLLFNVEKDFVDEILGEAKETIRVNSNYKSSVSDKLLAGIL